MRRIEFTPTRAASSEVRGTCGLQRPPEALAVLSSTDVAVIVCDHVMPGMTGAEFLATARKLHPDAVRITLTASIDLETARASINDGQISQFLLKPWDDDQLRSVA